jgi:hypothetical protein
MTGSVMRPARGSARGHGNTTPMTRQPKEMMPSGQAALSSAAHAARNPRS